MDPGVSTAPTGISVSAELDSGAKPITGTTITQNKISNEAIDIWVGTNAASVEVHLNDLGAPAIGIQNAGIGKLNARLNYWGCPGGPGATGCATIQRPNITTTPFLRQPIR